MAKKKSRKPAPPLAHIAFPKKGAVRKEVERLPDVQEELESIIGNKFIGALQHFEKRILVDLRKADPWPDFLCRDMAGQQLAIELVEVLHVAHSKQDNVRAKYRDQVRALISGLTEGLRGVDIRINDNYQNPPFPSPASRTGKRLAMNIADLIRDTSPEIKTLPVGRVIIRDWDARQNIVPHLGLVCTRFAPAADAPKELFLDFFAGYVIDKEAQESLLANVIQQKIEKKYPDSDAIGLMLLAYSLRGPIVIPESESVRRTQAALAAVSHPFKEVWYFFPYVDEDLGHLVKVWPPRERD